MFTKNDIGSQIISEGLGIGTIVDFNTDPTKRYPVEVLFNKPVPCGGYIELFSVYGDYLIGDGNKPYNIKVLENANV